MVNKKGFLRTIEAVIAIIMVLGLILYVTPTKVPDIGEIPIVVEQSQNFIIQEVATNNTFRECVLKVDKNTCNAGAPCNYQLDSFIKSALPPGYQYGCEVCPTAVSCISNIADLPDDRTVYARDTFIAGRPPKIFRVYMWEFTNE